MSADGAYFEVLGKDECRRLLHTMQVGWIAYCQHDRPQLVPVNFIVYQDEVVARTSYGSKLAAAAHGQVMTIGVDGLDPVMRTGWSVVVTGRSRIIEDLDDLVVLELSPLEAWAPGDKEFYLGIPISEISGRRIRIPRGSRQARP